MMAAMFNRVEVVDYLISKGADPQAKDANGVTALDAARTMGAVDTAARSWRSCWPGIRMTS